MEIVSGTRMFHIMTARRNEHCKDLQVSQPILKWKESIIFFLLKS